MKKSNLLLAAVFGMATVTGAKVASAQALYVSDSFVGSNEITQVNLSTGVPTPITSYLLQDPTGIATYNGLLYIADSTNGNIIQYNPLAPSSTAFTVFYNNSTSGNFLSNPQGLTFVNGNLFVANSGDNNIVELTGSVASNYTAPGSLNVPQDLTNVGSLLYVTEAGANSIALVASANNVTNFYPGTQFPANPGITTPEGIAADNFGPGALFVSDEGSNTVDQVSITSKGGIALSGTSSKLAHPWGEVFDASGDLFVADNSTNDVTEYTRSSANSPFAYDTIFTGITDPTYLTFGPAVPEPSTYAMLLAGLGMLYFVVRRRKLAAVKS